MHLWHWKQRVVDQAPAPSRSVLPACCLHAAAQSVIALPIRLSATLRSAFRLSAFCSALSPQSRMDHDQPGGSAAGMTLQGRAGKRQQ